jgi:hypothetical protein
MLRSFGRDAARMMMMGNGLDDGVRKPPKAQQIRSHLSVGNVDQLLFDFVRRQTVLLGLNEGAREVDGCAFSDHEFANIVHQGGQHHGGC